MKFKDKIKLLRLENKYTQQAFADKFKATKGMVAQWEAGNNYPSIDILISIRKEYGYSIDSLLMDEMNLSIVNENNESPVVLENTIVKERNNLKVSLEKILDLAEKALNSQESTGNQESRDLAKKIAQSGHPGLQSK